MTEGISKERLREIIDFNVIFPTYTFEEINIIKSLERNCTEFDPWMPIDSNTPWNKNILLWERETPVVGYYSEEKEKFTNEYDDTLFPTHYKLLLENPK